MTQIQEVKKSYSLQDLLPEEGETLSFEESFEIAEDENVIGRIHQEKLKDYLDENPDAYMNYFVRRSEKDTWLPVSQHVYFQRRRPDIVKNSEYGEGDRFYLLRDGQKLGPLPLKEIGAKLSRREVLVTDRVLPEDGGTWVPIFEIPLFDRRQNLKTANELPPLPEEVVFEHSRKMALANLQKPKKKALEEDAMVSLAYIGHIKNGKAQDQLAHIEEVPPQPAEENTGTKKIKVERNLKTVITVVFAIVAVLSGLWYFKGTFLKTEIIKATEKTPTQMVAPVLQPIEVFSPLEKMQQKTKNALQRKETRAPAATNPRSLRDSRAFKEQQNRLLNGSANDPYESDPIREQLSPETLDPQPIPTEPESTWVSPESLKPKNPDDATFNGEISN